MTSGLNRIVERVTLAGGLIVSALALASPAGASAPTYTCPMPAVYPTPGPGEPGDLAIADVDGDGDSDVAVANLGGTISVYANEGDGVLAEAATYSVGDANGVRYVVAADFNGDGMVDLAASSNFSDRISVLLNEGDGTFGAVTTVDARTPSADLGAGDFNGDGLVDLVSIDWNTGKLLLFLNNGDGTFKRPRAIRTGSSAESIAVGDFNGDGRLDLATSNINNDNSVTVLLNRGSNAGFSNADQYPVGDTPFRIAAGDFDQDGFTDLVTANSGENTFSVLFNAGDGSGAFLPATSFTGSGGQLGVVAADVNGDGLLDIIGANAWGTNIMVLLNDGGNTFLPPVNCDVGAVGPYSLAAADLNGDGTVDIVSMNRRNSISVLLG